MSEKELIEKIKEIYKGYLIWRAPAFGRMRWDIFGLFDLVLLSRAGDVIFIQVTTITNISHRRRKIAEEVMRIGYTIPHAFIYAWNDKKQEFKIERCGILEVNREYL